ncbi:MAG TPA: glycosyltransferase [Ktedonobacteraceae bacterium]|jgi:processive 1,2-diacylglycerol beta-glucosyltransferase
MARTILVLTSKTGGGHISLAESLRDRLVHNCTIELLDPQSRFFHWHYRLVSRYALWLWAAEFHLLDKPSWALQAHRAFTCTVAKSLEAAIKHIRPDLIITTYPFLTYEVVQALKKLGQEIPFVMLFADPDRVHGSWLAERRATATLAPTRETYAQALSVGFDAARLHQVGWPVRDQFYRVNASQRAETLERLGLNSTCFTIFLQGGGEGAAQFGRTVEGVLGVDRNLQIILATGSNRALRMRFDGMKNLYALPLTKEIAPYMAAADVIMGKAGPNMLFEAVTLGKPFIATSYIPGQEEANLEFIRRYKLGWIALKTQQQQILLKKLLANPEELQMMAATVGVYRQWNADQAELIGPIIEGLLR